ncbi:MAG TPA: DMT family transporter [Ilumatobacteraceae bacterium]
MGILLGAIAALLFGTSDVFAAHSSRTDKPIAVSRTALLVALIFTPLFLLLKPFTLAPLDVLYSVLSGVAIGTGLLAVYIGYSRAPIGVVAPIASVISAAVPVAVLFARGGGLSLVAGIGVVVGLIAVGVSTYEPGGRDQGSMRTALFFGVIAGTGFGFAFALLALTNDHAGLATVPIQRLSGLLFLTVVHPLVRAPWMARDHRGRWLAIACGLAAGLAMGSLQLGYRYGSSGPVSVAASQFAAFTVLISAMVNHDRLRWWQGLGLGLASVGVALMALG